MRCETGEEYESVNYPVTMADMSYIYASDGGPATASKPIRHRYDVYVLSDVNESSDSPESSSFVGTIQFQRGPRNDPGSTRGFFLMHLMAIAVDWLERAQQSQYACDSNAVALEHCRSALEALRARRDERVARGVLGTTQK